jgi:hypothetical protein
MTAVDGGGSLASSIPLSVLLSCMNSIAHVLRISFFGRCQIGFINTTAIVTVSRRIIDENSTRILSRQ